MFQERTTYAPALHWFIVCVAISTFTLLGLCPISRLASSNCLTCGVPRVRTASVQGLQCSKGCRICNIHKAGPPLLAIVVDLTFPQCSALACRVSYGFSFIFTRITCETAVAITHRFYTYMHASLCACVLISVRVSFFAFTSPPMYILTFNRWRGMSQ